MSVCPLSSGNDCWPWPMDVPGSGCEVPFWGVLRQWSASESSPPLQARVGPGLSILNKPPGGEGRISPPAAGHLWQSLQSSRGGNEREKWETELGEEHRTQEE